MSNPTGTDAGEPLDEQACVVRVAVEDLARLLDENERLRDQVTELQRRGTELVEENRQLRQFAQGVPNAVIAEAERRLRGK